jgi:hypothetical protein
MIILTQSLLKELENPAHCPLKIQLSYVKKSIPSVTNEYMLRGKYFEQMCIGSGAVKDDVVDDLPKLKNGNKSTDHIRIDEQVEKFKRLFDKNSPEYLGFTIESIQDYVNIGNKAGTSDILARRDSDGKLCIIDLKLTGSISYGYYSDVNSLDITQGVHYINLISKWAEEDVLFFLLVFDYSPKKECALIEITPTEDDFDFLDLRFGAAEEVLAEYEEKAIEGEWKANPSLATCKMCGNFNCKSRINE